MGQTDMAKHMFLVGNKHQSTVMSVNATTFSNTAAHFGQPDLYHGHNYKCHDNIN